LLAPSCANPDGLKHANLVPVELLTS